MIKKMAIVGTIGAILVTSNIISNINTKASDEKRKESVQIYVKCLNENYGQREYCAKQQNQHYLILDQEAKKEGYTFIIDKHYNLIIKKGE